MAKGKNLNPADAYRKQQRKKELKKNKTERSKARDFALVKKDTRDIEDEIEKLEGLEKPSADDKARLTSLKSELEHINKKKEEYVKEHPEQRRLVYRPRRDKNEGDKPQEQIVMPKKRNYFNKNGLPRHPERSIYYDPVFNPKGVAPPGMPYMERPLLPGEIDSETSESGSEDDDDIAMPEGPPPDLPGVEVAVESDDDIPMPEGPAPGEEAEDNETPFPPPLPLSNIPHPAGMSPPLPGVPSAAGLSNTFGIPPPPPGPPPLGFPAPSAGFPGGIPPPPPPPGLGSNFPPFAPNLPPGVTPPPFPPQAFQMLPGMPAPPPGFYPRQKSASAMQDPLSSMPHQTYQAHRANKLAGHPSLPARPTAAAATISAEPELRDFKKEATAFVPTTLKRKKTQGPASRVNAAPGVEPESTDANDAAVGPARPDLLSTIQNQFGLPPSGTTSEPSGKKRKVEESKLKKKDDYEKFMEEMGDILNAS
ncbi:proline-rich family protein [Moniliophthora roreri MCA 2997]|uniref:Proline-rich family protein n=1 Tax=Moniliophthora roreri (strain MCA 2997) TaxID=1381753 RepID=V2YKE2_MONRO|nr:proline-rich family protein [Moniliophthora roreri MCA 2997]